MSRVLDAAVREKWWIRHYERYPPWINLHHSHRRLIDDASAFLARNQRLAPGMFVF